MVSIKYNMPEYMRAMVADFAATRGLDFERAVDVLCELAALREERTAS